jgi:hypothetical protein
MTEENAVVTDPFEALQDYEPEVNKDGSEVIKGLRVCKVNHARVGLYEGNKDEFQGQRVVERELEIIGGGNETRRWWKKHYIDLNNGEYKTDKNGKRYYKKSDLERLADDMFTVGLKFKLKVIRPTETTPMQSQVDEASLKEALAKFVDLTLDVKGKSFKNDDGEEVQYHTIKGVSKGVGAGANTETDAPPAF